jgi:hypothetical protein
MDFKD